MSEQEKRCIECLLIQPIDHFTTHRPSIKLPGRCNGCRRKAHAARQQVYRSAHKSKINAALALKRQERRES